METTNKIVQSHELDLQAIYTALNRVQALIEFELDGTIIHANENFLSTLGYTLDEVRGQHHAMFCEPEYTKSAEYKQFWARLAKGEFEQAEYKRLGKMAAKYGSTLPTIPYLTSRASLTKSLNLHPTSLNQNDVMPSSKARSMQLAGRRRSLNLISTALPSPRTTIF